MQARTPLTHLGWASLVPLFFVAACVATSTPRIRACADGGSAGALRILPSKVPGVEIDSATWRTGASTEDIGAREWLIYQSRLRASRDVHRNELAILYEPQRPSAILDAELSSEGPPVFISEDTLLTDLQAAGSTATTARVVEVGAGFRVGKWSAVRYCPSTVQLVARSEVPFLLMPRLLSDSVRLAAERSEAARHSPLVVVKDSVAQAGWQPARVWAAINVADTALTDMVVALVVAGPGSNSDEAVRSGRIVEDTVEYHVGRVPARGRVGFVGGSVGYRESVVERISYPASAVTGRAIPRLGSTRRVSRAHAIEREQLAVQRERTSDSLFEQARTADVLWTDSLRYIAQRGRQVTPGVYEYQLTLVVRWQNPMPAPLYLPRCVAGGAPAYTVITTREVRTAYTPASLCPEGVRPLRIDPGSARVDTLHLRIEHAARPDWEQIEGPRAEGMFRLAVDVLTCDDGTPACRPPRLDRLSRSRPFQVRLGSM